MTSPLSMSQLCLTHSGFYLFLKRGRSFPTKGFLKDIFLRPWNLCKLEGGKGKVMERVHKNKLKLKLITIITVRTPEVTVLC